MSHSILQEAQFNSDLIPYPLQYAILRPQTEVMDQPLPLLYLLHGADENHTILTQWQALFETAWAKGLLPPLIVVTPTVEQSCYMDYRDGSQKWESLLIGPFLEHLQQTYTVTSQVVLFGVSRGGVGALRLGFKHPHRFMGVVALTPTISPSFVWQDQVETIQSQFGKRVFGTPFDQEYWLDNNPSAVLIHNTFDIQAAKLAIYLECTDADNFGLYEGIEFLHRVLWERKIAHEYRLMSSNAHNGRTMEHRITNGLAFVGRVLNGH